MIEAWASAKSFKPRDSKSKDGDEGDGNDFKPSNPEVDFKGQKRSNDTHVSRTDAEAVLYRKGPGKEAKLGFGAHAMMENRNGLLAAMSIYNPIESSEVDEALRQMEEISEMNQGDPKSIGADKGYHTKKFVGRCREEGCKPHVACVKNRKTPGLDGRTTGASAYKVSQRVRKRIEEIFGWMKTIGLCRKTRYRGIEKNESWAHFLGASYNLVRMANLELRSETG